VKFFKGLVKTKIPEDFVTLLDTLKI